MKKSNIHPAPNVPTNKQTTAPPSYTRNQQAPLCILKTSRTTFGPNFQVAHCTRCSYTNLTRVEYEISNNAYIAAFILCIVGFWCCCCIPFCIDSLKNAHHYCRKCGTHLGVHN